MCHGEDMYFRYRIEYSSYPLFGFDLLCEYYRQHFFMQYTVFHPYFVSMPCLDSSDLHREYSFLGWCFGVLPAFFFFLQGQNRFRATFTLFRWACNQGFKMCFVQFYNRIGLYVRPSSVSISELGETVISAKAG